MKKSLICVALILLVVSAALSQKRAKPKPAQAKLIVFAVISDGERIEPIGEIDKGKLIETIGGDGEEKSLLSFSQNYYKPKTNYNLIFGGAKNGTVTIVSSNPKSTCGKNAATVTTQSTKAKLKGLVMGLATNETLIKAVSGLRRLPTATERAEIESLVRAEFLKQSVAASAVKNLKYLNLTALDVDNDKRAEMVGTFWVETAPTTRALLFFIADKGANGKYAFGYSEFKTVKQEELMSGSEIKMIDDGIYHERLLDALEYDGDNSAEIFTYTESFEGSSFYAYSRRDGKWVKAFEGSNYHCAF